MDWRSKAACLTVDPELFFPIGNTGPAISQVAEAKAVCRECDVKGICLQWAIDNNQDSGVWGGMSEEERRSLKRRAHHEGRESTKDPRPRSCPPGADSPQAGSRLMCSVTSVPPPSRGAHSIDPLSSPRTIW